MDRPSRKAIREALDTVPIDRVLGVPGELTHKQKTFARLVAQGNTGADAYRKAYNAKGKPTTVGNHASRLKRDDRIKAEIEAFQLAQEAAAYHAPAQLRSLVIHSLVQVITNPDAKESTKVQAAKVLGTVAGVDAFVHRSEHRVIKTSEDAKAALLAKLRDVMAADATDVTARDVDSLLAEIVPCDVGNVANVHDVPCDASQDDPGVVVDSAALEGETPTPQTDVRSPSIPIHTIPHNRSESEPIPHTESLSQPISSEDPPPPSENPADELESELRNTPR